MFIKRDDGGICTLDRSAQASAINCHYAVHERKSAHAYEIISGDWARCAVATTTQFHDQIGVKKVAENPDLPKWNGYANTI